MKGQEFNKIGERTRQLGSDIVPSVASKIQQSESAAKARNLASTLEQSIQEQAQALQTAINGNSPAERDRSAAQDQLALASARDREIGHRLARALDLATRQQTGSNGKRPSTASNPSKTPSPGKGQSGSPSPGKGQSGSPSPGNKGASGAPSPGSGGQGGAPAPGSGGQGGAPAPGSGGNSSQGGQGDGQSGAGSGNGGGSGTSSQVSDMIAAAFQAQTQAARAARISGLGSGKGAPVATPADEPAQLEQTSKWQDRRNWGRLRSAMAPKDSESQRPEIVGPYRHSIEAYFRLLGELSKGGGEVNFRRLMERTVWATALLLMTLPASSEVAAAEPNNVYQPDKVDRSVTRALRFLMSQQDPSGFISDTPRNRLAMTSLSVLALAAVGHQPSEPTPEGRAMKRALQFVLQPDNQDRDGYFGTKDGSRMYGHGITTLMLGELSGHGIDAAMDRQIFERLQKAVQLILKSQKIRKEPVAQGGWRYRPDAQDSDLSVTVWQIMALRSARNAGLKVPSESIDAALDYVRRCYGSDLDARGKPYNLNAGFAYQPERNERLSTSTSAMGLLCLQLADDYDSSFVKGSTQWLSKTPPFWGDHWMFYGSYYYAQGMYQRGGRLWEQADKHMQGLLLPEQQSNGAWESTSPKERQAGKVYATSLAVLALSVKFHYLPIYQR